jgi:hypothetical protein
MCYSVESSAKTSLLAFISIAILLKSNNPYFKWIALMMTGWCSMQVAELLLWLTNPRKSCTAANKVITLTLIPLILISQPVLAVLGSFFVKPWSKCSQNRRMLIVGYCIIVSAIVLYYFFDKPTKYCTIVTEQGHLQWFLKTQKDKKLEMPYGYYLWLIVIAGSAFLLWDISYKALFVLFFLPVIGFIYSFKTDSKDSIWCYYSSFSAIAMLIVYGLYKFKIYNILK